jgi:hypothetical protein
MIFFSLLEFNDFPSLFSVLFFKCAWFPLQWSTSFQFRSVCAKLFMYAWVREKEGICRIDFFLLYFYFLCSWGCHSPFDDALISSS